MVDVFKWRGYGLVHVFHYILMAHGVMYGQTLAIKSLLHKLYLKFPQVFHTLPKGAL